MIKEKVGGGGGGGGLTQPPIGARNAEASRPPSQARERLGWETRRTWISTMGPNLMKAILGVKTMTAIPANGPNGPPQALPLPAGSATLEIQRTGTSPMASSLRRDDQTRRLDRLADAWNEAEIARPSLSRWIEQFSAEDQPIALRLLECMQMHGWARLIRE